MEITIGSPVTSIDLKIAGKLDSGTSHELESCLEQILQEGVDVVRINLSALEYLSSAGIRVLLSCHKRLQPGGGELQIVNPSPPARMVLGLAGLEDLIP